MTWDLRGKTVLITGAARGIGAETARRVAAAGANVALVGLEPEELERVAAQCGSNAAAFECDVTDWHAVESAVEGAVERFGGIDVVMANAGIAPAGMTRSMDPRAFERTLEINLMGVWRTVRTCLPHVIERQGYVLVVASLAAAIHGPGMAAYAASKAGAEAFADSLRVEVKRLGVDVGVAYFAFIDTDMVRGADAHPGLGKLRQDAPGPFGKTYPLSAVGKAVAEGMEKRSRWVVVPGWARALLVLRTALAPLIDRGSFDTAAEADRLFQQDVENRGTEAASAPVGPGGEAGSQREPAGAP
ncbi:MAG: SDR family NAD(P)-dependent oxidoreductase [Thermoleophilaceae bacterium]|nr:SDR family NAD(P)-dependent oxidoreductase [Thermoleophilaceae bacterium]